MKNIRVISLALLCSIVISLFYCGSCDDATTQSMDDVAHTDLTVKNSSSDTIEVYLTLGSDSGYVNQVHGIFGIADSGLQGSFSLLPNESLTYKGTSQGIQGNISFGRAPENCPSGTNLFEFCLNNYQFAGNQQETVDISCVAGVSSIGSISMLGGSSWNASDRHRQITKIKNSTLRNNTGRLGVYPYGCDDCTKSTSARPSCITDPAEPQKEAICNVQRSAKGSGGGVVCIDLIEIVK